MKLLEFVVKEFISVVEYLENEHPIENDRIIVEREEFKALLGKYNYTTFSRKTKIYKQLNFIVHDKNNYTMPYKDTVLKKTVRKVIINYNTYIALKHLYETVIDI